MRLILGLVTPRLSPWLAARNTYYSLSTTRPENLIALRDAPAPGQLDRGRARGSRSEGSVRLLGPRLATADDFIRPRLRLRPRRRRRAGPGPSTASQSTRARHCCQSLPRPRRPRNFSPTPVLAGDASAGFAELGIGVPLIRPYGPSSARLVVTETMSLLQAGLEAQASRCPVPDARKLCPADNAVANRWRPTDGELPEPAHPTLD